MLIDPVCLPDKPAFSQPEPDKYRGSGRTEQNRISQKVDKHFFRALPAFSRALIFYSCLHIFPPKDVIRNLSARLLHPGPYLLPVQRHKHSPMPLPTLTAECVKSTACAGL